MVRKLLPKAGVLFFHKKFLLLFGIFIVTLIYSGRSCVSAEDMKETAPTQSPPASGLQSSHVLSANEEFLQQMKDLEDQALINENIDPEELPEIETMSGTTISDVLGMDANIFMNWMNSHEYDDYYLTTPYVGGDWRSPNGDISFNGTPGMNCTGFIWHFLTVSTSLSGGRTDLVPGFSGWISFYRNYGIERQYFPNIEEMLNSGYAEKGDIVWSFVENEDSRSDYNHILLYWGDGNSNVFWHSLDADNHISSYYADNIVVLKTFDRGTLRGPLGYLDVHESDWFFPYAQYMKDSGIMTGLNENYFGPNAPLARAQFATILYRMQGAPSTTYETHFPDVPDTLFYSVPVTWAWQNQVIEGYDNGSFGPNDNITREQLTKMLYYYAKENGYDTSAKGNLSKFYDAESVSDFAEESMKWAVGTGLITGDQGAINPQGFANRAECAAIITRFNELYQ